MRPSFGGYGRGEEQGMRPFSSGNMRDGNSSGGEGVGVWRVVLVATLLTLCMGTVSAATIDDFEDGDISEYSEDTGGYEANTNTPVFSGSYSLKKTGSDNWDAIYASSPAINSSGTFNVSAYRYVDGNDERGGFGIAEGSSGGYRVYIDPGTNIKIERFTSSDTGSDSTTLDEIGSLSLTTDAWYKITIQYNQDTGDIDAWIEEDGGSDSYKLSASDSNYNPDRRYILFYDSGSELDLIEGETLNSPPSFDSVSTEPESWTLDSSINVSADVSDSDGTVSSVEADVWENGTQILNDASLTENSGTWSVDNLFTVDESDVYYNYTLTATDDDGATSQYEDSQFIKNEDPEFNILGLENQTYFRYSNSWTVDVFEDGDNVEDENISCTTFLDGNVSFTFSGTEPYTESGTVSADLGGHSFKVSCTDPAGNTRNKTVDYTVKAFEFSSTGSQASVFETEDVFFDSGFTTGSMVENVSLDLSWNGSVVNSTTVQASDSVESLSETLYHTIPLAYTDGESVDWRYEAEISYQGLDGNSSTKNFDSGLNSQTVDWSYYIESADTDPANGKYIETENLKHNVKLHTETKKAEITGVTTYDRNGETSTMEKEVIEPSYTLLRGNIDVGKADGFNKSQFEVSSNIKLSFNGESRQLTTGKDPIEVYKIILTDGNTSLNTADALKFDVNYEEEGYNAKTRLTMDLSLWKNRDELIRRYSFQEDAASTHTFNIYPSWAEYKIRTLSYPDQRKFDLIQYFNNDKDYVRRSYFFPTTQTISNTTTTVPLKTLNRSESTAIDFEITNSEGDPALNTYCRVDRKFGGGDFETVFMIKTGSEGRSQSFAEVNEIYYGFTCYRDGQVADTFAAQIMQNPMRLQLGGGTVPTTLDYYLKFDASCSSNTTQLTCNYQSQTEKLEQARLVVERQEVRQDIQVCDESSPTVTGKLTCKGLNSSNNFYEYRVVGEYPNAETQGASGFIGSQAKPIPGAGLFMTAIVFMLTTAATAFDLKLGIGVGALTMLLTASIKWVVLTPSQKATLIAVAVIAGVAVSR